MLKRVLPFVLAVGLLAVAPGTLRAEEAPKPAAALDSGDTAWMLVATGLVMLMVPGLALFYGGMARRKNILGTMMQSMVALAVVGLQWVLFGYAIAFGKSQGGWFGWDPDLLGLQGVEPNQLFANTKIPIYVHCMYQGMFAIITPALISGALAERIRFGPYCLFLLLWSTFVYAPLAHWVWAIDADGNAVGWLGKMGALDFAGGTVVHIAAGVSGLAAILLLRKRIGYPEHAMHPSSVVLTLLGGGLLWFGWFGFNGGSALGSGAQAGSALTVSQVAAAAAALTWMLVEWLHRGKPTALGFATGLVAGLVGITPASGFVRPLAAVAVGAIAALCCYAAVALKPRLKYDDSLDAFGVHGIGGMVGALLTGLFVVDAAVYEKAFSPSTLPAVNVFGSEMPRIVAQAIAVLAAGVVAFVITAILVKLLDISLGFCLDAQAENEGLDRAAHGEVGFELGPTLDAAPAAPATEPRPAQVPPAGQKRFTAVVEGGSNGDLLHAWSDLCQVGAAPPSDEFRAVYPFLTTVQGNRFRFRGGDPDSIRDNLQRLFEKRMSKPVRVRLEK
jgi:ammonium transporter